MKAILFILLLFALAFPQAYEGTLISTGSDTLKADSLSSGEITFPWSSAEPKLTIFGKIYALDGTGDKTIDMKFKPGYDDIHANAAVTLGTVSMPAAGDSTHYFFNVPDSLLFIKKYKLTYVLSANGDTCVVQSKRLRK